MADEPADVRDRRDFFAEPSSKLGDALRYSLSMAVVVACGSGLAVATSRSPPNQEAAAELDSALMIDLPPAEASSRPSSDAADGPEQQAAQASSAQQTPETIELRKPVESPKPTEEAKPPAEKPTEEPPPQPDPLVVPEREHQPATPPPKAAAAPPTQAQDAHAPAGSETPVKSDVDTGENSWPSPSAHSITLWQKSLMKRLETAKRQVGNEPHAAGTVKVAFEIDAKGELAFERVARSSGSATLDKAALLLVRRAAPFPAPPAHAASGDTSFVVPVRFR